MDGEMTQNGMGSSKAISGSRTLIIRFLKLVAQHFRTTREVSFYAEQLCITTTYLYKLTHRRWNLSPCVDISDNVQVSHRLNIETTPAHIPPVSQQSSSNHNLLRSINPATAGCLLITHEVWRLDI